MHLQGIEEGAVMQTFDQGVDGVERREGGPGPRPPAGMVRPGRVARRRAMRDRAVVPLVAVSLSALVPGAGQLLLRRWRRGAVMLAAAVAVVGAAALLWPRGTGGLVETLVRPRVLLGLLIGNVLLGAFRVAAAADAWWLARRRTAWVVRWHRDAGRPFPWAGRLLVAVPVLALVAGLLVAPHAVAGYAGATAYSVLTSVFGGRGDAPAPALVASQAGAAAPAPATTAPDGRLTVLLLGGDAGPGRSGLRTDTMMVLTADPASGRVVVVALPRNLRGVPLPGRAGRAFPGGRFPDTFNALYGYAGQHPDQFPAAANPGAAAVKAAPQSQQGLPKPRNPQVDLAGLVDVIDARGGVTVRVADRVNDRLSPVRPGGNEVEADLLPGRRRLDGEAALVYVRSRSATNDYDRMHRQRCLLAALADQADLGELLRGLPRLAAVAKRSVDTDITPDELPRIARLATSVEPDKVVSLAVMPPYYAPRDEQGYPTPRPDRIRRGVRDALAAPGSAGGPAGAWTGGESLASTCA
jgi:LCP family protein required for cell wall assembly